MPSSRKSSQNFSKNNLLKSKGFFILTKPNYQKNFNFLVTKVLIFLKEEEYIPQTLPERYLSTIAPNLGSSAIRLDTADIKDWSFAKA